MRLTILFSVPPYFDAFGFEEWLIKRKYNASLTISSEEGDMGWSGTDRHGFIPVYSSLSVTVEGTKEDGLTVLQGVNKYLALAEQVSKKNTLSSALETVEEAVSACQQEINILGSGRI